MDAKLRALWAKKDNAEKWLPLVVHMADTAELAKMLWDKWVANVIKERIEQDLPSGISVKDLYVFLACIHDLGKASPAFQFRESWNTPDVDKVLMANLTAVGFSGSKHRTSIRHEFITHCILERFGLDPSVAVVVGGHHGRQPELSDLYKIKEELKSLAGFKSVDWLDAQQEVLSVALDVSGLTLDVLKQAKLTKPSQILLSGLVIMVDWMASSEEHFPLISTHSYATPRSKERAERALQSYKLPPLWRAFGDALSLYETRFNIHTPYPVQEATLRVAEQTPDLMIIEAPMGEGKTEASLAAAELIASRRGCRGVYFALPTQATTNAMFDRIVSWVSEFEKAEAPYSARLMHGKAEYNEKYTNLKYRISDAIDVGADPNMDTETANIQVHEWFEGSKKGILSDFAVGTIDQILLAGLRRKHLTLKHLGLAGKVVIVDECHAYDTYMLSYLRKVLTYLGAYRVPVIILSATLPANTRHKLVSSYLGIRDTDSKRQTIETPTKAYPQITYVKDNACYIEAVGVSSKVKSVAIRQIATTSVVSTLEKLMTDGCYAGVIANTVRKAQELYTTLSAHFPDAEVELLHSGFMQVDRSSKEERLVKELGKGVVERKGKKIVVGTQIFEQSMDIDFDVLITDLCPIDLLLQRIGRLHRHNRNTRPVAVSTPTCYVMDTDWGKFDKSSMLVYGPYLLAKTRAILPDVINIPNDIAPLVSKVYDEGDPHIPTDYKSWYDKALKRYTDNNSEREKLSKTCQIGDPRGGVSPILGWISGDNQSSEQFVSATVRGSVDSLEVIPVVRKADGFYPMAHLKQDVLPICELDSKQAKQLAKCSLRLPYVFGIYASKYIKELTKLKTDYGLEDTWCNSYWLKQANFLIFNENGKTTLGDYTLNYSPDKGIEYYE